ncbi:MAG TPA: GIY-YIG nuclease family protein [Burkholderiales bacterium]|nr:GIY-YIG nuclease family protein [Burkholderiales bacterium]
MQQSPLRLFKRSLEHLKKKEVERLPRGLRGIYVLYCYRPRAKKYEVVYVGMTNAGNRGGIRGRLKRHRKKEANLWTHCSAYEVWDNITTNEVAELERLFRHIYRLDPKANRLNVQRGFKKIKRLERIQLI